VLAVVRPSRMVSAKLAITAAVRGLSRNSGATITFWSSISSSLGREKLTQEDQGRVATVNTIELNAIERFYRAHADAVYAFLVSLCRDPIWAEDLMQDTFVKATRSMGGYRGGNPRSWLFSIARSVFIDDTRRRRAIPVDEIEEQGVVDSDVAELIVIERSLSKLPERQRTALLLADKAGMSYAEVAEAIGCSDAAVKVLIHRARMSFRAHYTETNQ